LIFFVCIHMDYDVDQVLYVYFFFFQAEDGIRDYKVTGVQTCALPISNPEMQVAGMRSAAVMDVGPSPQALDSRRSDRPGQPCVEIGKRRVGKECRSRWWR